MGSSSLDRHVSDLLSPYLDGELTSEERRAVEAHLGECPPCRGELADLRALSGWLGQLRQHDVPRSFAISPRAVRPPALNGAAGGFLRALTTIAASLVFLALCLNLLITGLPRQAPTTAAPSFATAPQSQPRPQTAAGQPPHPRPQTAAAPAQPAAASSAQPTAAAPAQPAAASSAVAQPFAAGAGAGAATPRPGAARPSSSGVRAKAGAQSGPLNEWLLGLEATALAVSLSLAMYSVRWWRR